MIDGQRRILVSLNRVDLESSPFGKAVFGALEISDFLFDAIFLSRNCSSLRSGTNLLGDHHAHRNGESGMLMRF